MKTVLIAIGKTDEEYLEYGIKKYTDRIGRYIPFEIKIIPDVRRGKSISEQQQKNQEGQLILKEIAGGDVLVIMDEAGKEYTSRGFSEFYQQIANSGAKRLIFVIGGPYGFSEDVYKKANYKISLSKMTYSHQMVRLIFTEQLYRAQTIIKGEPYHHD
ncbi:MAG: 23S rRNA (pseudouridine(1915)-N(3))-methyltransferase RlmH [Bacteroidales bacterium]|nr:23S rRNA (pseudouridine(1915)-N(3))-methyltransferase RlmH [Bacteroidales bacterium]